MANRRVQPLSKGKSKRTVRVSVSIPEAHYTDMEYIAQNQHVSLSWVVSDAVQKYLLTRCPLLENTEVVQTNKSEDDES
jgi:metal-responsive CopG/Arc/MetJ family transcriptional regulator